MKNSSLFRKALAAASLVAAPFCIKAQDTARVDTSNVLNIPFEELIKFKSKGITSEMEDLINERINVTSKKPLSVRRSPNIVSLITEEEIKRSGARDLTDVLRLVPGLDFGVDVQGQIGLGVRGSWANEGKVLILLDGQEMNEIAYGTLQFGNNYPLEQIKKIEIIRGPGSSVYGGFAEYMVINIVTKNAAEVSGLRVTSTYGQMERSFARRNVDLSIGKQYRNLGFTISGLLGQGRRSEQEYTDIYGSAYDMMPDSKLDNNNLNIGFNYKKLSVRAIYDQMNTTTRDAYDVTLSKSYPTNFTGYFFETKYDWSLGDKFVLTPKINFKRQRPWEFTGVSDSLDAYETTVLICDRYGANITGNWNPGPRLNLIFGTEAFYDYAESKEGVLFRNSGTATIDYFNNAAFVQSTLKSNIANITLGARLDNNNAFGNAFVPRLGFTKRINKLNLKLLWGNSFRAPSIQNFQTSYNARLKPEKSQTVEFETSYLLNRKIYLSASVFDITTRNPIIYFIDTSSTANLASPEGYMNKDVNGSMGVEGEFRLKDKWGYVNLTYSYYTVATKTQVDDYSVEGHPAVSLAFPAHKATLNSSFNITPAFFVSPSICFYGKRYGYNSSDSLGEYILGEFKEQYFLNLYAGYTNLFVKGLAVSVGVFDILNEKVMYIQPYAGGHAPLPGASREFIVKIRYQIHYKED